MKSTRETRRVKEEQTKKTGKAADNDRPQRAAFGDLTNAVQKNVAAGKKEVVAKKTRQPVDPKIKVSAPKTKTTVTATQAAVPRKTRKPITTTSTATTTTTKTTTATTATSKTAGRQEKVVAGKTDKKKAETKDEAVQVTKVTSRKEPPEIISSQESIAETSQNLSDMVVSDLDLTAEEKDHSRMSLDRSTVESVGDKQAEVPQVPAEKGVEDVDTPALNEISQVANYAYDIFEYYKEREIQFRLSPYLARQPQVTQRMRAVLVDWLVEVQENFELNHETLYLSVKLVDTYFAKVPDVQRDQVQLVGAVALFLSAKYDERMPPAVDDFIYICDHAYDRDEFLAMERKLFRVVDFDLGRPISYRFLRRYARCARSETKTLYLARYILELSLMEYKFVFQSESMLAASVLYIAMNMREEGGWTPTLEFYTGYTLKQLKPLILEMNCQFVNSRHPELRTIREKYKHQLFLSVAQVPTVSNDVLFATHDMNGKQSQCS